MRSTLAIVSVVLLAGACAGDDGASRSDTASAPPDTASASPDTDAAEAREVEPPPVDEFEALVNSYDRLSTVAGAGSIRDKGDNGWSPAMEGGPATAAELSRPHMAMADDALNLYIADKDAHAVRRVDPAGVITTVAGTNVAGDDGDAPGPGAERRLSSPNGLWVRGDGTLHILDLGNAKIRRLATDGTLTTRFRVDSGISTGRGLWVSEDEAVIYVASGSKVLRWTQAGGVETWADGFASLGNLVVDPDGRPVVTDRGANRVYRVAAPGQVVAIAGSGEATGGGSGMPALHTGLHGVRGVWFLANGGYFLATHEGSQVWYVDSGGVIHLFLDGADDHSHSGDGEFFRTPGHKISEARAVSVDRAGNVIVTESDFGYVRMVRKR